MTTETLENAIKSRFLEEVEEPQNVPVQYDNAKFTTPDTGEWMRVTIVEGQSNQIEIGSNGKERTVGVLVVQCFTPLGNGTQGVIRLVDAVKTAFKRVTVDGVRFRTPTHVRIGKRNDQRWWQENVRCPFYMDAT